MMDSIERSGLQHCAMALEISQLSRPKRTTAVPFPAQHQTQIFLNGEPIITSQSTIKSTPLKEFPPSMHNGGNSSKRIEATKQHSSGNVTGLTGSEFLSLPAGGARIAVTIADVDVSERIEGFLQLQKI